MGKLPREELWFGCHPGGSCLVIEWGVQLRRPFIRLCKRPMKCHVSGLSCLNCEISDPLGAEIRNVALGQLGKGPECQAEGLGLEGGRGRGGWEDTKASYLILEQEF